MENLQKEIQWLLDEKYGGESTPEAEKDIARLEKGEHLDYVIGWVDFLGCKIDLSLRPLIPRPETEYWVEKAVKEIREGSRVLDIFAGSGCIGIAVLKHTDAVVDFAEKEKEFLEQIRINADLNGIGAKRYSIIPSDIFSGIQRKYDYILANPPYVAEERRGHVQESVLAQEPLGAVFGGKDGLQYTRKFLEQAKNHLVPGGVMYLEFDSQQKQKIGRFAEKFGYKKAEFRKDQYNKWRYARICTA
jgi:release factor glutamine methyltransferase